MDRERERRKRKEGSERGMIKKKEHSDSKSKGSRSSEGSFKDRERGKGKGYVLWYQVSRRNIDSDRSSDVGVKIILKDVYDKIKTLELELNETHKIMVNEPKGDHSVSRDRIEGVVQKTSRQVDTSTWLDLISKHKE